MSPYELGILLHIYARCESFREVPILAETIDYFLQLGVIEPDSSERNEHGFKTTQLGKLWVEAILKTPMPMMAYVSVNGGSVEFIEFVDQAVKE